MRANFRITDNYAVNYEGKHIDLHNNFDFTGFEYSIATMTLVLSWVKSSGDWVAQNELRHLRFVHRNVSYLTILPRDPETPLSEDFCLSDVTFFPSSMRDDNESILSQDLPIEEDDVLYIFQSGQTSRVHCEE